MPAAPVAAYAVEVAGDAIIGYAAPAAGRHPCMLRLEADGAPVAIAWATRFSDTAAARGLRLGWCGVRLEGLAAAGALADHATLCCIATGQVLLTVNLAAAEDTPADPARSRLPRLPWRSADTAPDAYMAADMRLARRDTAGSVVSSPAEPLTVAALIAHARRDTAAGNPLQILPFAEASLARHGIAGLLEATYRSFYGRAADAAVVEAWTAVPPAGPALAALRMVLTSLEYRDAPHGFIPGPFHPGFAFDLSPLDA